jgi:hypothetical protein
MNQGRASRRSRSLRACAALALGLAAGPLATSAGARATDSWRFDPSAQPVTRVADDQPIPPPEAQGWNEIQAFLDDHWARPVDDLLAARAHQPAQDVNALDEVPLSSWFAGARSAAAAGEAAALRSAGPFVVEAGRVQGDEPYLIVRDPDGGRYLLSVDAHADSERGARAAVVASRLLHAAGFPAPPGRPARVARETLTLSDGAVEQGEFGGTSDLTGAEIDRLFPTPQRTAALFELPDGVMLGGFRERGTRAGDPNDRIPHEHRRSLRGLAPLCAWLDHRRLDEAHTLDLYASEGQHVQHLLTHLTAALGVEDALAAARRSPDRPPSPFGGPGFDPLAWQPRQPYAPFLEAGWGDLLWGVRVMLEIPESELRDAVEAARFARTEDAAFLAGALRERRSQIARAWLGRLNGAIGFRVLERAAGRWQLTCEDLAARHGLRQADETSFSMVLRLPETGERLGLQTRGGKAPEFDLTPFVPPDWAHRLDARRYAIAEVRAWDHAGRPLHGRACVHLYFDRETGPRIVGIVRD